MSIENAILELAAALRYSADTGAASTRELAEAYKGSMAAYAAGAPVSAAVETGPITVTVDAKEVIEKAVQQIEADAAAEKAQVKARATSQATQAAKTSTDEAEAKKPAGSAGQTQSANTAGSATEPASLDYQKDVKPVLIKFAAAKGKPELSAFVKSFGVDKATEFKPEQLADVLAQANAALAA